MSDAARRPWPPVINTGLRPSTAATQVTVTPQGARVMALLRQPVVGLDVAVRDSGSRVLKLRTLSYRDLPFASDLHTRCLGHGLFPALGPMFLRAYLRTFVTSPHAVGFIAECDDAPVGFLVGVLDEQAHYRYVVRRRGLALGAAAAASLVVRPRVAWWFARTRGLQYARGFVRLAGRGKPSVTASGSVQQAVLTHVAVSPAARTNGVGSLLVNDFASHARLAGLQSARLVTKAGDDGAGRFYEKLGWRKADEIVDRDDLRWTRYTLPIT